MERTAHQLPGGRRFVCATTAALMMVVVAAFAVPQGIAQVASAATGWVEPFAGTPKYEKWAPTEAMSAAQVNQPLGTAAAERIATALGLNREHAFTPAQYKLFITGKGIGGDPASSKTIDQGVRILSNTIGTPLYTTVKGKKTPVVIGSYGLMVTPDGLLQSPANAASPARKVNLLVQPGGYMETWMKANKARDSWEMLYASAYTSEAVYSIKSQDQSGVAQLASNKKSGRKIPVGMSMVPSLWLVNFTLIYTLNPDLVAHMPAKWMGVPANVAKAIKASKTGQVPYGRYALSFLLD